MTSPAKQSSSRWGSFLQQAVAGVESRLDNILAEGQDAPPGSKPASASVTPAPAKLEPGVSRSGSNSSRTNDRLQERLARAVAAKQAQKGEARSSSNVPSRTGSPITASDSPRQSIDAPSSAGEEQLPKTSSQLERPNTTTDPVENGTPKVEVRPSTPATEVIEESPAAPTSGITVENEPVPRLSVESTRSSAPRDSIDSARTSDLLPRSSVDEPAPRIDGASAQKTPAEYEALLRQLQSDYETSELQRQDEVHGYIERIDALQAKLQYLAKENLESAKKAIGSAPAGSLEKKLAEKEQQVVLLMEEGQTLSKKELTYMTTIKKLRAKIAEDSKEVAEAKKKQEKAETDAAALSERLKRVEGAEKRLNERNSLINRLQKDLDAAKVEKDAKDATINSLRAQLEESVTREKQAETKLAQEALEAERKRVAELEDDISNLKIEKELVNDRAQIQIKELREKLDREAELARVAALEMKNEQQMLESKLEVMRARAEEVSSGATGDAQAKLLRQIETLQTQYAVASENWQGIEASLTARTTSLEKERDEAIKREADVRRKAREVALKAKRNEDELEETRSQLPNFQQELTERSAQLDNLKKRAEEAEAALVAAKAEFEDQKQAWKFELQQRIDEERQKMQDEMVVGSRAESPAASRRGLTSEYLGLQNLQLRRASARSTTGEVPTPERLLGRRPSVQPLTRSSGHGTPTRQDSTQSFTHSLPTNGDVPPQTPSIHTLDHDDFFEHHRSSSPQQTIHDIVSTSTAAAGPSVQLVERMSSAVRKLESEKVSTKEDLARIAKQRDEARAEIVQLMKEVESKREVESRIKELEAELEGVKQRYETTLEMLGEKSELVEELKGDVQDLKAMYKELVIKSVSG
ncbi:m repeat protein [Rutstroemia sp. NJR-2017a WRK4]|nr:m repeat protein [Rutstroemia sp. NJR-2017a WRK4]